MKKIGILLGVFCLSATLGFGEEKPISFIVSGGLTRLAPHDLNSFLQDYTRYYLDGTAGRNFVSKELRRSTEFEFTLLVRAAPRIFLTFGSGIISADLESEPLLKSFSDLEFKLSRVDKIRSIPIKVGLLYSWPLSRRLSLSPHLSLDGYISSFKETGYEERKDLEYNRLFARDEWEIKTRTFSWGSTVGLSLDVALSATVSLSLDAGYRRARLAGFHGTDARSESDELLSERDFRLFYYEFYADWMETGYKFMNLPFANGSTSLDMVRDAVLDLSGPYLKAGLRVSF